MHTIIFRKIEVSSESHGQIRIQLAYIRVWGVRFRTAGRKGAGLPGGCGRWRSARRNLAKGGAGRPARRRLGGFRRGGFWWGEEGEFLVDLGAEFVVGDATRRLRMAKSSSCSIPSFISFIISSDSWAHLAAFVWLGWGRGRGVEIIFFILAKQMPVIIRVELNYFEVAIFIPYYVLYLGYIYHTLIDVLLVFSSPMLMY